jgi:DNA polymerase-3 subunit epsilon
MAFEWLTGSTPQFWKNYLSLFENENTLQKRYVVFDMETTGADWREDVILSVGAIAVVGNAIEVGDFLSIQIRQDKHSTQFVANSGLLNESGEKFVEAEGIIQFINFVKDATLVGHNINLDIEMINQALKRLDLGRLKNPIMDTNALYQRFKDLPDNSLTSLDDVCDTLKIDKNDRNTAWGNAFNTAMVFLKLKRKLNI